MKTLYSLTITLMLIMVTLKTVAVPATPYPIDFKQPDGKVITILLKGDENLSWQQTIDGYTLMFNEFGYLTYAVMDERGDLQPSDIVARQIEERDLIAITLLKKLDKGLFYSSEQCSMMTQINEFKQRRISEIKGKAKLHKSDGEDEGDVAVIGKFKTICALVQFPERSFVKTLADFEGIMNQLNYTDGGFVGSVRDFFREASYNKFDLQVTLVGPYTAPESEMYYTGSNQKYDNCSELAQFLLDEVDKTVDFSEYDGNGDEIVDGFHFLFAGYCQAAGAPTGTIWSHKSAFQRVLDSGFYLPVDGKWIAEYSCSPELRSVEGDDITYIGVIAHEMSHAFGAMDFYDTDGDNNGAFFGTGLWDIMAHGSWNEMGNRPPHHNMYQKIKYGWVEPVALSSQTVITDMPNSTENAVAYIVNTNNDGEYFILENKQQINYDLSVPGHGLLIYRISSWIEEAAKYNRINANHPQLAYPVCASATSKIPENDPDSYGAINSNSCPFADVNGYSSFTDKTVPAMLSFDGNKTNKPITNITESDGKISFDFMTLDAREYLVEIPYIWNGTVLVKAGNNVINNGDYVYVGTLLTIAATPNPGYLLDFITVNDEQITGNAVVVNESVKISAVFSKDPNGVMDFSDMGLRLYPNPACDELNIDGEYELLEIYNTLGKLMLTANGDSKVDVSSLGGAVYIVKVYDAGKMFTSKLIKN